MCLRSFLARMPERFDVIVLGLGAMGSQVALHLAARGLRVAGFDRHHPPHALGSSSGETRIIREAYFEDPRYVPLVRQSLRHWRELERGADRQLHIPTGGLMIGPRDGRLVQGALRSAELHRLPHDLVEPVEIHRRFPAFAPPADQVAVWEPNAGVLLADACIDAALKLAGARGADLRFDEPVRSWETSAGGVRVVTSVGPCAADRLVIAAGPWLPETVPGLPMRLAVARQTMGWVDPSEASAASPSTCPIWIWEWNPGRMIYGFPDVGSGAKVARHYEGEESTPDTADRGGDDRELDWLNETLGGVAPGLSGRPLRSAVCFYTTTPDQHFLVDTLPDQPRVTIVSPCSGHGFKFAPVIGEIVADLVTTGETRWETGWFGFSR